MTFSQCNRPCHIDCNERQAEQPLGTVDCRECDLGSDWFQQQEFRRYFCGPNCPRQLHAEHRHRRSRFAGPVPRQCVSSSYTIASPATVANSGTPVSGSYESGNVNVAIRELKTSTATLTISTHMAISNLTVTLNISAVNDGGLVVKLVSPGGQEVILSNQRGGSGGASPLPPSTTRQERRLPTERPLSAVRSGLMRPFPRLTAAIFLAPGNWLSRKWPIALMAPSKTSRSKLMAR